MFELLVLALGVICLIPAVLALISGRITLMRGKEVTGTNARMIAVALIAVIAVLVLVVEMFIHQPRGR